MNADHIKDRIQFRGKRIDNDEWVYGYLGKLYQITSRHKLIGYAIQIEESYGAYEIDTDTLGQFTTCYDKNGKMVFTGDIIDFDGIKIIVNFVACHYSGFDMSGKHYELPLVVAGGGVVIGNIYDNPEILEVKCECGNKKCKSSFMC